MGSDAEWKKAAMTDDAMVAELLLRLNQALTPTPAPPKPALSLEWSVRQRRSKAVTVNSKYAPRASPTTPLSWSGATSHSGGGGGIGGSGGAVDGGSEESSKPEPVLHPKWLETSRSNKVASEAATCKRPRRKKTLAELREEEILLLKEKRQLKKELATLRVNMEKQKATNENLKRLKLDLPSQPANGRCMTVSIQDATSGQVQKIDYSDPPASSPVHDASLMSSPSKGCSEGQEEVTRFALPDLNLPFEEDCSAEVLCGAS